MKGRRWLTWLIFCICALAVLEALGWLTWQAMRLEERERQARAEAKFQESIRLALWRMEGEVTPMLAQEGSRPYFQYLPFYAPQRAYSQMWDELRPEEVKVPSPLLEGSTAYVKLYFQLEPDGRLTSPQAPTGKMRELAEGGYLDPEFLVLANERLTELRPLIAGGFSFMAPVATARADVWSETEAVQQQQGAQAPEWQQRTQQEYNARKQAAQTANMARQGKTSGKEGGAVLAEGDRIPAPSAETSAPPAATLSYSGNPGSEIRQTPFTARWVRSSSSGQQELLLHRTVDLQIGRVVQGFWIDWSVLRGRLRDVTSDILPEADFAPAPVIPGTPQSHLMASIPVLLAPGEAPIEAFAGWSPTRVTLAVTWIAVLAAVGAIGVVLRKSMELSDRRGRFVSAVTHELRTPLTTFCLYTEMLADGMVPEEASRDSYLNTLKAESRRLAGIVENVLEYARLGGKKPPPAGPPVFARDLISRIEPALVRCADRCGMRLTLEGSPDSSLRITADLQTVERILLNLVDNACKYASDAHDRRVHIAAASLAKGGRAFLELRIRDHGPGVPPADVGRIFKPFRRGRGAAEPKAGLGLGLALSKGLARELGGDLILNPGYRDGAEFVLTLPA